MSPTFRHGRGHKIHYVEEGQGGPVVFAHGFVMDHTMFAAQFEELPRTHRCIAWDMRGHGHSDTPDGPWSMADLVADLEGFIEEVAVPPCDLVGMSLGGMTAVRVALQRPDLVRSLVLVDSSADGVDPGSEPMYRDFQAQVEHDGLKEDLARSTLPIFYAQSFIDANPDVMDYHVDRVTSMPAKAVYEGLRVLIERGSVTDRLGELKMPALFIHGELDAALPVSGAEKESALVPGSKLVKIPGAGHSTPIEAPDAVNEALASFFS